MSNFKKSFRTPVDNFGFLKKRRGVLNFRVVCYNSFNALQRADLHKESQPVGLEIKCGIIG
jgi:hypothetical protein